MQTSSFLDTLDHLWAEDAPAETVASHFKALPGALDLTDWFQGKSLVNRLKAQHYLRTARSCVSYRSAPSKRQLLFAWPLSVAAAPAAAGWKWARGEAQNGLSLELADLDAQVQTCAEPISCEDFQTLPLGFLAECVPTLAARRDPFRERYKTPIGGPALWVGLVTVPEDCAGDLEDVLFVVGAEVSRMTKSLAMRMEALVEEEGGAVRVFPPTAIWNASGLARLAHARLALAPAKKSKGPWVVQRRGTEVRVSGPRGEVFVSEFPEETNDDLAPLFTGWTQAPELHLNELQ